MKNYYSTSNKKKSEKEPAKIENAASPEKRIFAYSPLAEKPIQLTYYSKQQPQLKECPDAPEKIHNDITDAD